MKCAIMQPTYLPWTGYFRMINEVDLFVFLDDVQFAKRSWQQRNRILLQGREQMLTVPVLTKGKRDQRIMDVQVDDTQGWRSEHLLKLQHAYGKHAHGAEILELLAQELSAPVTSLAELNMNLIKRINASLKMATPILRSSELNAEGSKSQYLIHICQTVKADSYLSAPGSRAYIEEEGLFAKEAIAVEYMNYEPSPYPQKMSAQFISHMSIVDLIANVGFEAARTHILGAAYV
ncbi:WbqC family protein [Paenibacillus protaetiae]|uniref:WbqC family protein n=1 Tax=Paenibacillus protaetiae TaxID=2509456 RepID=A0A4P6EY57_9BACL|nr:WbqC family protein [Paenibacillus protaetiae]QAY67766.1 hypothetical protein ET464_16605 [Paenibacillus protaetiae]